MPELVFFRRGDEMLRLPLDRPRIVLGRGERSDVVIPDPEISRAQAVFLREGEQIILEDLSGHGTVVAGKPATRAVLADGADIALGQWRAIYRERSSGSGSDAATEVGAKRTELQPRDEATQRWQAAQIRVRSNGQESVHKLTADAFSVGKDPGNDLVLSDRFISGRHLRVIRHEAIFRVVDQNSTNGTFIGPVRIYEAEVPLNTTLKLGESEIVLEPASQRPSSAPPSFHGLVGSDPSIRQLADLIERVAPSTAAVAIFGESGTGKELVANAVHALSTRAGKPFIPVNCAAISKELIESELFGHEKGAFTGAVAARKGAFEEADGGTLFLDEIGELPLELQAKLLRALESGEIKRVGAPRPMTVNVRVVAATNQDLIAALREGRFREDLYYRLCVIPLHLSPLRNRRGDVLGLAEHFVRTFSPRGQTVRLTPAAVEKLQNHGWPGNIRELRNVVHRALLLRRGPTIDAPDITFDQEMNLQVGITIPELPSGMSLENMMLRLEKQIIEAVMRRHQGNRALAARDLGLGRSTLFKRLKDFGLIGAKAEDEAE